MSQEFMNACDKRDIEFIISFIDEIDFTVYDRVTESAILLAQSVLQSCLVVKDMGSTNEIWDTYINSAINSLKVLIRV